MNVYKHLLIFTFSRGWAKIALKQELDKGIVTLVYGAKDEDHNQAVVLQENNVLFR